MSEWKKVKLGDCIKEISEKTTKNNQYKVLSVTKDGIFSQEEFFKKQIASKDNIGYKIIRKNNLVFSTMNLWMGSLDVLTNYDIGIVSPAYKVFEFNEKLMLPEYGNYFMKSYYMLEQYKNCSEQGASVVRRNLDLKSLLNITINIPLIEEQEKIVEILKTIDSIIEKYENLLEEKNQFIKSQFVEMFKNTTTKKKLGEICYIKSRIGWQRLTKSEYLTTGEYYLITGVDINVKNTSINYENCYYVTKERYEKDSNIQLKNGDVIITKDGTIGKVALIKNLPKPATLNSHLFVIRDTTGLLNNRYLADVFKSYNFTNFINKNHTGTTRMGLNQASMVNYEISIPNMELQKKYENFADIIDRQIFALEKQKQNYEKLKKCLIQQLLTGKIKVKI